MIYALLLFLPAPLALSEPPQERVEGVTVTVDTTQVPELREWAENAKPLCEE